MTLQIGDRIPETTLKRIREGVETIDTPTLFTGRKAVLFAVPGAFTPTCSARHLPGFKDHLADIKGKGVMRTWYLVGRKTDAIPEPSPDFERTETRI